MFNGWCLHKPTLGDVSLWWAAIALLAAVYFKFVGDHFDAYLFIGCAVAILILLVLYPGDLFVDELEPDLFS